MTDAAELTWLKSTHSNDEEGECLELARCPHTRAIHIRDSKNPTGPTFTVRPEAWSVFAGFVKG
ncbi:DUF397 domain-containing protein [Streptomyces sp. NPDC050400]|uniref:DUF397 domain-containing protein n=1 Tax=Streptomyces sp. NPDC050400 TaxID=3365610 RepID=UPI0037A8E501